MRIYNLIFQLLSSLLFLTVAASADTNLEKFKVGVILPLSGEAAAVGAAIRNGMLMGLDKLDSEVRDRIELIFEDDGFKPKNTLLAYAKLKNSDRVQLIVNAGSGTANALSPIVEKDKIPLIAIATDPQVVRNRKYVVNFWVTPEEQVRTLIPEALRRGYKNIARISTIHDFPMSMKKYFDIENKDRLSILLDEEFQSSDKDFKSFLTKLKVRKNIDAILMGLMPGQLGIFAKQARQMGIDLPLFGFETLEDSNEVKVSGGALVGQWYVNTDDPNDLFIKEFKLRYPDSSLYGASNAHDIALLLGAAVERKMSPSELNDFLHSFEDFSGALGTYSASGDNRFTLPAAVKIVTKDGFEKVRWD